MQNLNYSLILPSKHEDQEKIPLFSKGKNSIYFRKKNKKFNKSLRKKISRKRMRKKLDMQSKNKNLFFCTKPSLLEIQLQINLASFLRLYTQNKKTELLYENAIGTSDNEQTYRFFYNKLIGKIQTYQLIDTDQGANFEFSANKFTKFANPFTYLFYFIPIPVFNVGAGNIARIGLKFKSDQRKIQKTKNKLRHCITETNFIKLLSILLTKIHERDIKHQENIELFLETRFKDFWTLFKQQAKKNPNKADLNQFWTELFVQYFKKLNCPYQKEDFYEAVKTLPKENTKSESLKNLSELQPSAIDPFILIATIGLLYKTLETNLQQEFFIIHFQKLIQTYIDEINFIHTLSLLRQPTCFWPAQSTELQTASTCHFINRMPIC